MTKILPKVQLACKIKCGKQMQNIKIKKNKERCIFLTLRQWSLLFAIIILIITTVVSLCAILGRLHIKEVQEILENDIEQEEKKHIHVYSGGLNTAAINFGLSNEDRLKMSRDLFNFYSSIFDIVLLVILINFVLNTLMLYGVCRSDRLLIMAGLIFGFLSYCLASTFLILLYLKVVKMFNIHVTDLIIGIHCGFGFIIFPMWCTIVCYCQSLATLKHRLRNNIQVIVHSRGVIHKLKK